MSSHHLASFTRQRTHRSAQERKLKETSEEHGLIPGWRKDRKKASTTQEQGHKQSDEPMFQYGGIVSDDESDGVERLAIEARALSGCPKRPIKVNSSLHSLCRS